MVGNEVFNVVRVSKIFRALQDARDLPGELLFLGRTASVPAVDEEIMGRFVGRVQVADIIADDERANIYQTGKFAYESVQIPNLKHGVGLTQAMLNQLSSLDASAVDDPDGIFRNWERRTLDSLLLGVRQREESIIMGMLLDSFSYDRLGIKMTNVSWGMPADLKVTASPTWDTPATAKPVDDILNLRRLAQVRYGQIFNRMTMSLAAFTYMIATVQFQTYMKNLGIFGLSFADAQVPQANVDLMKRVAQQILGIEIEFYDSRYWSQAPNGDTTSAPFLPITKVLFTNSAEDNNSNIRDWANGIVTESIVQGLVPSQVNGNFSGPTRGPVAYVTAASANLNPPGVTYWSVARGFSRKHRVESSAVITAGAFTDPIPVTDPF